MSTAQSLVWAGGGFCGGGAVAALTVFLYYRFRTHPEARRIDQEWEDLNQPKE